MPDNDGSVVQGTRIARQLSGVCECDGRQKTDQQHGEARQGTNGDRERVRRPGESHVSILRAGAQSEQISAVQQPPTPRRPIPRCEFFLWETGDVQQAGTTSGSKLGEENIRTRTANKLDRRPHTHGPCSKDPARSKPEASVVTALRSASARSTCRLARAGTHPSPRRTRVAESSGGSLC